MVFKPYGWKGKEYYAAGPDKKNCWHHSKGSTVKSAIDGLEGKVHGPVETGVVDAL